jgi:hypothetical protein
MQDAHPAADFTTKNLLEKWYAQRETKQMWME